MTEERNDESSHDRVRQVSAVYDRWSSVYDWNPAMRLVSPARKRAVESLNLARGDTAVDMGTGTGANLPHLRRAVGPTGTVIGIDASDGMLARARDRIERHDWENVHLVAGDIRNPPISGPIDGIISSFVVTMFDDADRLIDEWTNYIEDGALASLYASPSSHRWCGPVVSALLEVYCRLFNAGWNADFGDKRPGDVLARRGEQSRTALAARAVRTEHEDALFGLVTRDTGYLRN